MTWPEATASATEWFATLSKRRDKQTISFSFTIKLTHLRHQLKYAPLHSVDTQQMISLCPEQSTNSNYPTLAEWQLAMKFHFIDLKASKRASKASKPTEKKKAKKLKEKENSSHSNFWTSDRWMTCWLADWLPGCLDGWMNEKINEQPNNN